MSLLSCSDRESYTEIESPGSELLGGLVSYSPKEILDRMGAHKTTASVTVIDNHALAADDRRPQRDFYTVTITPHEDLGHAGRLLAQFYNNRLYLTTFTPDDFTSYMAAFEKTRGRLVAKGDRFSSGNTEYWRGVDYRTNLPFVGALDVRLREQDSRWVVRYSSAPELLPQVRTTERLTLVR